MTIPQNITKDHVLKAIKEIDEKGVPPGRGSKTYFLIHDGKKYPPKYVISLANKYANGEELDYRKFNAQEAVRYLEKLGFEIVTSMFGDEEIEEVEEAVSISLERDLEEYLVKNISALGEGLKLVDRQRVVPAGRIDLLAEDPEGNLVVIELKAGKADERSFTQLMAYISCLREEAGNRDVRGILVASDFTEKVLYAKRLIPSIKLKKYRVRFEFEDVD